MHKGVNEIVGIGIIGPPPTQEYGVLKVTDLDHVVLPLDISHLDLKFRVEGHDVFCQHEGGCLTHVIPRVVGDNQFEAFVPHFAVPGLFHALGRLFQIKFVDRNVAVVRESLHIRVCGHDHEAVEHVLLVGLPVKGVQEGFPHVDIREKVGRNAFAVEGGAADIRIACGIDFQAEHACRKGQLRDLIQPEALHGLDLRHVGGIHDNTVGVSALEHEFSGAPLFHVLDDGGLDLGFGPPVVVKPLKNELFGRLPEFHGVGACAILDFLERLMTRSRVVVRGGVLDLAVPAAFGHGPLLIQDRRSRVAENTHQGRIGLWQVENNLVPSGFDGPVDGLEDSLDDLAITVTRGTAAGQGLKKHPHGTAVRIHDHVPFEAVHHVLRGHLAAFVKPHSFADGKGVCLAVL